MRDDVLLQVVRDEFKERSVNFLYHEWVVSTLTAPYLVLGTRSLLWVEKTRPGAGQTGVLRSGIRPSAGVDFDVLYSDIVAMVANRGLHQKYGQVHEDTVEGVQEAVKYLLYYLRGPSEYPSNPAHLLLEVLTSESDSPLEGSTLEVDGKSYPVIIAPWLPPRVSLAVPKDRGFLGDLHLLGPNYYTAVVHNPARGIAISAPEGIYDELAEGDSVEDDT